ncbi:MAG: hypothetical protein QXF61_11020 [Nitrososphaeria archaeon]
MKKRYIIIYEDAPPLVWKAVKKLSKYTGIEVLSKHKIGKNTLALEVYLNKNTIPNLCNEGFSIKRLGDKKILISANSPEGLANGVYDMLRFLMSKKIFDPFKIKWDIEEKPFFRIRAIQVGYYNFNLPELTPDTWTLENWREYIDFLRLLNANMIICLMAHDYLSDVPQTEKNKWRFEILKKAMEYAQEVGIKFHLAYMYNFVPQALWWRLPEFRAQELPGYHGIGLCWSKAKHHILRLHENRMRYFSNIDGYQLLYLESCGICACKECLGRFSDIIVESFEEIRKKLKEVNPRAECVFQYWLASILPYFMPEIKNLPEELLKKMPKNTIFLDASGNFWRKWLKRQGKNIKDFPEHLNLIYDAGYRVINYFFFMDEEAGLEASCNVLPYPHIREIMNEIKYSRENLHLEGVCGYRLAPLMQLIGDFVFFRLAFKPDLTMDELVEEIAGLLTTEPENKEHVRKAILLLEEYWSTFDTSTLEKAAGLFEVASKSESSKYLKYIADGVSVLLDVHRLSERELSSEEQSKAKMEIYEKMKNMFIYQGYTTEHIWESRAISFLFPRIDWWVKYIREAKKLVAEESV